MKQFLSLILIITLLTSCCGGSGGFSAVNETTQEPYAVKLNQKDDSNLEINFGDTTIGKEINAKLVVPSGRIDDSSNIEVETSSENLTGRVQGGKDGTEVHIDYTITEEETATLILKNSTGKRVLVINITHKPLPPVSFDPPQIHERCDIGEKITPVAVKVTSNHQQYACEFISFTENLLDIETENSSMTLSDFSETEKYLGVTGLGISSASISPSPRTTGLIRSALKLRSGRGGMDPESSEYKIHQHVMPVTFDVAANLVANPPEITPTTAQAVTLTIKKGVTITGIEAVLVANRDAECKVDVQKLSPTESKLNLRLIKSGKESIQGYMEVSYLDKFLSPKDKYRFIIPFAIPVKKTG